MAPPVCSHEARGIRGVSDAAELSAHPRCGGHCLCGSHATLAGPRLSAAAGGLRRCWGSPNSRHTRRWSSPRTGQCRRHSRMPGWHRRPARTRCRAHVRVSDASELSACAFHRRTRPAGCWCNARGPRGLLQWQAAVAVLALTFALQLKTAEPDSATSPFWKAKMPPPSCVHEAWGTRAVSGQPSWACALDAVNTA